MNKLPSMRTLLERSNIKIRILSFWIVFTVCAGLVILSNIAFGQSRKQQSQTYNRDRISINNDWTFYKYRSDEKADDLIYDNRPVVQERDDEKAADAKPTEAVELQQASGILKPWIMPSANRFISDPAKRYVRPHGEPGIDFPFTKIEFDDSNWKKVNLPHDWAIQGPFMSGAHPEVGGGMGRLPSNGVAWYRRKLDIPLSDNGKSVFLDVDGAMSYAMVWLNGKLVGGWPYGYNSWRLDLTPYILPGKVNQLAIRVDNPNYSSRWYAGGGIYRNVWLTKTSPVHVSQWGTYVTCQDVTKQSATINLKVSVDNDSDKRTEIHVSTEVFSLDDKGKKRPEVVGRFLSYSEVIAGKGTSTIQTTVQLKNPRLWGPLPTQTPNLYVAVTSILVKDRIVDTYETRFGIRSLEFHPDKGLLVNGERIQIKGVNEHHDLGSLGAAFNVRATERKLEILREMGCNAIRMAHNPPAPEFLELTDRMGFLVYNEIFDSWERKKTPHDFHLIFPDWHEADARSFIRRDRNSPSVIIWGFGNEVGEQYTGEEGASIARRLNKIFKEEDPTRPVSAAMNFAKPDMPLPGELDIISLNYQGEGIRQDPEFEGTDRIRTPPQYDAFHVKFPDKLILSSETASAFSSRGVYFFPVAKGISEPVRDGRGGDSRSAQVSSYELHAVDFGSSADKVFASLDRHPYVAGEFVWTGWDHLGEPTPYYQSRSSYCGIIDLAGFRKDRFYLYQSHWRKDLPMVHILPHWNWPERVGEITPVHVFTSGDEVELFLNGRSLGKKKKGPYQYRLRWDSVVYEPGDLRAVSFKHGSPWAEEAVRTTGKPSRISLSADKAVVASDGEDLVFISVGVEDVNGNLVPRTSTAISFKVEGPAEIISTDNGDPTDMRSFSSTSRNAFNGRCLVIVRPIKGSKGNFTVQASADGLSSGKVKVQCR